MHPLYYLPNLEARHLAPEGVISRSMLAERLLGEVWRDVEWEQVHRIVCQRGPDKNRGLIVSTSDARLGYYPDEQTWECLAADVLWVGYPTAAPPTPVDLQRRAIVTGHNVELAGNNWIVPVIRRLDTSSNLPQVPKWADGACTLTIRKEWQALWEKSGRMWDVFAEGSATLQEVLELAVDALAVNYRVDRSLITQLEILDTTNWEGVLRAACDWPVVEALLEAQQKKTTPAEAGLASTTPGSADDSPSTDPAAASSTSPPPMTETVPPSSPCSEDDA